MLDFKKHVYTTKDVIREVGISRLTLYRWLAAGKINEVSKDYRHHRIFTKQDIDLIKQFKEHVDRPNTNKKRARKNWSPQFLALAGSWQDDRSLESIVEDIYSARRDEKKRDVHFPE